MLALCLITITDACTGPGRTASPRVRVSYHHHCGDRQSAGPEVPGAASHEGPRHRCSCSSPPVIACRSANDSHEQYRQITRMTGVLTQCCLCTAADGITYERKNIELWVQRQAAQGRSIRSPITKEKLAHTAVAPNPALFLRCAEGRLYRALQRGDHCIMSLRLSMLAGY